MEGNEKRKKSETRKNVSGIFFFPSALFTSAMGEVKRAARERRTTRKKTTKGGEMKAGGEERTDGYGRILTSVSGPL